MKVIANILFQCGNLIIYIPFYHFSYVCYILASSIFILFQDVFILRCVYLYIFERQSNRRSNRHTDTNRDRSSVGCFTPQVVTAAGAAEDKGRPLSGSPAWRAGPSTWAVCSCFPQLISRRAGQRWKLKLVLIWGVSVAGMGLPCHVKTLDAGTVI